MVPHTSHSKLLPQNIMIIMEMTLMEPMFHPQKLNARYTRIIGQFIEIHNSLRYLRLLHGTVCLKSQNFFMNMDILKLECLLLLTSAFFKSKYFYRHYAIRVTIVCFLSFIDIYVFNTENVFINTCFKIRVFFINVNVLKVIIFWTTCNSLNESLWRS